jgi:hypothetical protein
VAIAALDESVQSKVDILVADSAPDFQLASRDAALVAWMESNATPSSYAPK